MELPYTFSDQELAWIQATSLLIALIALLISVAAVYFTLKTYRQKKGQFVRGTYSVSISKASYDTYVSNITLENLKDKAVVIFGIYLKLSNRVTLEIEDLKKKPLILKPFEAINIEYDPVHFYGYSDCQISLNKLFASGSLKNKLVLATTGGRLVVKRDIPIWDPEMDYFKNPLLILINPIRYFYNGKSYGSNCIYLVLIYKENKLAESIPIYPNDHYLAWFNHLGGNERSLSSKSSVENMFYDAVKSEKIKADKIEVIDMKADSVGIYNYYPYKETIPNEPSWILVSIIGRWKGFKRRIETRKLNRKLNRKLKR